MQNVSIIGVGQTPVGEHWELSLRHLALQAVQAALDNAGLNKVDAIIVGNALGGVISNQNHLGALVTDFAGMRGTEAFRVEAADASGGVALRQGYLMVASGMAQTVMVLGVEKVTDLIGSQRQTAMASFLDAEYEAAHGATPVALAALLMRRYMHEYGVQVADFANFSVNAHANGSKNANAMYRNLIRAERFSSAPLVADPVNLFDVAPEADGAAAVILTSAERAADLVPHPVRILASAVGTDALAVHDRPDPLCLMAASLSAQRAYEQASIGPADVDLLELHDSSTIMAALSLEACGFADRGEGWRLATDNRIGTKGSIPISTFGGLKSRGNPFGATGVYQAVEVVLQLRGEAGENQIEGAQIGMTQNLGGLGGTAVTHLFGR
jgi:acetyl-CoA C-acetyltransferase